MTDAFIVGGPGPKWMRTAYRDDNGVIFVPPAIAAVSEMEMLLCAGYDGIPALAFGEHVYYPADWVEREFPASAPTIKRIRERLSAPSSA